MTSDSEPKLTIYFDGICNLCNSFVNWLISHDQNALFRYASLQGETARVSLPETLISDLASVVVQEKNGKILTEAQAVLFLFQFLNSPYPTLARILKLLPDFVLNFAYRMIAKNRYRLFGKKEFCRTPTESEKKLFLN